MDDLQLLRELRAGLPAAQTERRAAARAALLARAEHSARPRTARGARGSWLGRRRMLIAAAAAIALLLIALPTLILGGGGGVQPALAQVLRQAAAVAASQEPSARPGPGQYFYTRSREAYLTTTGFNPRCRTHRCDREHPWEATNEWSVLVPKQRQEWIGADGSGRARVVSAKPEFLSRAQRRAWVAAGSPPLRSGQVEDFPLSGPGFLDTAELPTDPAALRKLIEARKPPQFVDPPGEAETFTLIGDLLRNTYLPSAFRAALYRVTAELPGVELLGDVEDPVGRTGIGIAYTKGRVKHELIFDPDSSALLGEREVAAYPIAELHVPRDTEIGSAAYLESKVVDSVGRGAPRGAGQLRRSIGCYDRPSLHADTTVVHGADPIATCAKLWREGVVDTSLRRLEREGKIEKRPERDSPHLVACASGSPAAVYVFPGSAAVCRRLGLAPLSQ